MKIENGMFVLDDPKGFRPTDDGVYYTDQSNMGVFIPMKVLIRLYEGTKFSFERRGGNWEDFCDELFNDEIK